ncbi:hypothetical protein KP509_15G040000 [Ceratopteris richardii]|uniref:Uncharacterized protein n=1 Tax=Ceratopteris richardii TaxID=49495 RepID=A0A8T2T703_CERRI|nr:hypothetical protein KP509_15G040000 [Ceratopteris richardii]
MMKFVEVQAPDGKAYRFAAGTKARFAAERISARLQLPSSEYLLLEAICPGEEPVEFGPDAELTHLDDGWKLRALSRQVGSRMDKVPVKKVDPALLYPGGKLPRGRNPEFTFEYISKIFLSFVFMFVIGFIFKTILEQLPTLLDSYKHVDNDTHEL